MLALRLGRAWSGKDHVLRVDGHYHGWHDYALKGAKAGDTRASSLGIPGAVNELDPCLRGQSASHGKRACWMPASAL